MKLTKYKLARIKSNLPQEDRDRIDEEIAAGKLSPEMKSTIDKWLLMLAPKRLSKTKGAFGKLGTNRKFQKLEQKKQVAKLIEEAKKQEDEKSE